MNDCDDTTHFNFQERDKFLSSILELKKLTRIILEDRKKSRDDLIRLRKIIDFLHEEIQRPSNREL